jgi:hypothetical protein
MKFIGFFLISLSFVFFSCETKLSENIDNRIDIKTSKSFNHIDHIRKESEKKPWHKNTDKTQPTYFVDYTIENLLKSTGHKKYITDRRLLRKLKNITCWENYILIKDTLSNGDKCVIEIKSQNFSDKEHKLVYEKETNYLIEIDGKYPFGTINAEYQKKELKSLTIKINGKKLNTNIEEYKNLYNPNFCNFGMHIRIAEVYEDGDNLYIYIFGGNAADTYFAKLIFDKSGYITSIVADYFPLSIYGSFGKDFIGY